MGFYTCYWDHRAHKTEIFNIWSFQKKFSDFCSSIWSVAACLILAIQKGDPAIYTLIHSTQETKEGSEHAAINRRIWKLLTHSEATNWNAKNFYDTVGQQHPWILHADAYKAIFLGYMGFLTTITTRPQDWHLPVVLCVHFMRDWAQEQFFLDCFEIKALKSFSSAFGNSTYNHNSPESGAHIILISGLEPLSRILEDSEIFFYML